MKVWRERFSISDATTFVVYMGDRELAAFNRRNVIHYNAAVALAEGWDERNVFALTCHELAHEYSGPHEERFACALTRLVARYAQK